MLLTTIISTVQMLSVSQCLLEDYYYDAILGQNRSIASRQTPDNISVDAILRYNQYDVTFYCLTSG